MNNNTLVSIVVPIYNVEDYLDECIESIIRQTYNNIEIVLVDDGSPDSCPQKCDEWANKDSRIIVVHKQNGGLSSARNAGLNVAKGYYIAFVDSDDFITSDYVEVMYNRIRKDENVGIVSGKIYRYSNGKITPFYQRWNIQEERITLPESFRINTINLSISFTVWNKIFISHLLKDVRFREGRLNEDTLFMYDLGKVMENTNYTMVEIPHYVYYYRYREDSICTSSKKPLKIDVIQNLKDMMKDCKDVDKALWDALYFRYVINLFDFLDELLENEVWKPLYFRSYHKELKIIPFIYVYQNFSFKKIFFIELIKWWPQARKLYKIIREFIRINMRKLHSTNQCKNESYINSIIF